MTKVGDIVRYLNDVGGGRVVRIEGNMAWVDDDGFETPVLVRECVVVRTAEDETAAQTAATRNDKSKVAVAQAQTPTMTKATDTAVETDDEPVVEIPGGDILNITLGFEPTDRHRLTESDFDASLINDSNYFIYFNLASRDADTIRWASRYAGIVEPNTELWLGSFARLDIATFDHIRFQYIAFKRDSEYTAKDPGSVDIKVDTTKFFKLHCYRPNPYFENDVIAFNLVDKDTPADRRVVDLDKLKKSIEKNTAESRPERRPVTKHRAERQKRTDEPLVVDLHINSLLDTTAGMSAADMLNYQIDTFRRIMDENLRNFGRKIIFIHGKGEGVLRQAITKELNHRYRGHDARDASFREYGYGATQVTIRQNISKSPSR